MKGAHTVAPEGYRKQGRLVVIWLTRGAASVGVLDSQPTKGTTRGRCSWSRRDQELQGETRGTQFRHLQAVRCVIPYVLYAA
jgi:hypothetical protein